ncbi:tegument protein UL26 [Panine betaherpesvirus 2]|uniref:Tegument protein UL26 n=1 Tax=Panine betaherpesvirus 2 TaxID=188763 RepID=Q8QS62_9BETA|nr:tegument protein UL26 [Panine betaherpesvirus 2]AAM00677.1 tegument protein UL26 [Panine betaherpesvirus 2]QXV67778.1 tegument protein UL26 [Panine betaherpesvirus 2]
MTSRRAAGGGLNIDEFMHRQRGRHLDLPYPEGYTLFVCEVEDTILTKRDMAYWKLLVVTEGQVRVIGTLGRLDMFSWDRSVVGVGGDGSVLCYEIGKENFVVRAADSLAQLLERGLLKSYFDDVERARQGQLRHGNRADLQRDANGRPISESAFYVNRALMRQRVTPRHRQQELTDAMFEAGNQPSALLP